MAEVVVNPGRLARRGLRNRSAEILREVRSGATYEITKHGEVVAVLSPPTKGRDLRVPARRMQGGFAEPPRVRRAVASRKSSTRFAASGDRLP